MADLSLSGLASGFDWKSVVDQLTELERTPQKRLRSEQSTLNKRKDAVSSLVTELENLKSKSTELAKTTVFTKRTAKSSDEAAATLSTTDKTPTGAYKFEFTQLATASIHKSVTDLGKNIYTSNVTDSSGDGPVLSSANFGAAVTGGTFTVNGKQVSILTSDTLQEVFAKIATATGNAVTASYDATTDKITLTSAGNITLGSTADTSNFLQLARLSSGGATVVSSTELGRLDLTSTLGSDPFKGTALADGGSGSFKVNGIEISYSSADTLGSLLQKITDSTAGVDASYDSLNDQILLTNKQTGSVGIALEDVGTGNFLAAAKLTTAAGGTLTAGQNVKFKVNNGAEVTGLGNTITEIHHGIAGLTVNALKKVESTVTTTTTTTTTGTTLGNGILITQFSSGSGGSKPTEVTAPSHGLSTGQKVKFSFSSGIPTSTPQVNSTADYYVKVINSSTFSIHLTASDANAGSSAIDFGNTVQTPVGDELVLPYQETTSSTSTSSTTSSSGADGSVTFTIGKDTTEVRKKITDFIDQYNKIQALIDTQTASSTDVNGKVTAGILATDRNVAEITQSLRSKTLGDVTSATGTIKRLENLGYKATGFDNKVSLSSSADLDSALANSPAHVQDLFTNTTDGIAVRLNTFLESIVGVNGTLITHRDQFSTQSTGIDTQIVEMEKRVQITRQRLMNSFLAMEKAQGKLNQQMQFLAQRFK